MDDVGSGGAAGAETSDIGAVAAPGRERRMTAGRKRDAVMRVFRGEPLEIVVRELRVPAAALSGWRDAFLDAGSAGLPVVVLGEHLVWLPEGPCSPSCRSDSSAAAPGGARGDGGTAGGVS